MHLPFLMLIERSETPILLGGYLDPRIRPRTSQTPKDFDYPKNQPLRISQGFYFMICPNLDLARRSNARIAQLQLQGNSSAMHYFRDSGLRHSSSGRVNNPSLRISTSSNQISPPPYSGLWIITRSQWIADLLPLGASS